MRSGVPALRRSSEDRERKNLRSASLSRKHCLLIAFLFKCSTSTVHCELNQIYVPGFTQKLYPNVILKSQVFLFSFKDGIDRVHFRVA